MGHGRFIVYFVAFAAFLGPFTQTIYTPMLPEVIHYFHTSQFLGNFSISIFTIILALMQIVYGPLTDSKGRRNVLLLGVVVYTLSSFTLSRVDSIGFFLFFRAMQAAGIATGSVVAVSVIGDLFTGKERAKAMGEFQMLVALGPVFGPTIRGIVGGNFGYHGIFYVLTVAGIFVFVLNYRFLVETKPDFGTNQKIGLNDFRAILRNPAGSAIIALGFIQYYTFYNFLVFLPDILSQTYHLDIQDKGMVFISLSLMIVVGSYLGGLIGSRFVPATSLITTASLNVASIILFMLVAKWTLTFLITAIALFGLFFGLSLPVQTTILTDQFKHARSTAVGIYNFFRFIGMGLGPLIGSVLYHVGKLPLLFGFAAGMFALIVWYARKNLAAKTEEKL
jgi:MFS family permease